MNCCHDDWAAVSGMGELSLLLLKALPEVALCNCNILDNCLKFIVCFLPKLSTV